MHIVQLMWLQVGTGCGGEASALYYACFHARLLKCFHDMVLDPQRADVLREQSQVEATSLLGPSLRSHIASLLFIQGEGN